MKRFIGAFGFLVCVRVCVRCVRVCVCAHTYKLALSEALFEEDARRPDYVVQHVAVLNQSAQWLIELRLARCVLLLLVCVALTCTTRTPQLRGLSRRGPASFYRWWRPL